MINLKNFKIELKHVPVIIAVVLIFIGIVFFFGNIGVMGNLILLAVLIGTIPYIILNYLKYQKIKFIEEQLPVFLSDLAEAQKTGMGLPDALRQVSKKDYGRLTSEIKKVNDQISWGIPVQDALKKLSQRINSKMVKRVMGIITEAYSSGGDISRTMETTAEDIVSLKEAEKERYAMTFQHVIIMYAIYFIFIGIIIGLSKTLIPMLQLNVETAALGGILTFQDPCIACINNPQIYCISCSVFTVTCQMFNLGVGATCYYNAMFVLMVIIQGIFTGLVAGQIGEGSVIAGFKHSVIMTSSGFAILILLLQTGVI